MQGEKECSYYMKTGHCKFGGTCKFHHPELGILSETPTMYPSVQPSPVSSPHPYPHLANWQMGRPPVVPGSFLPGSYPPMMLPPTLMPMQGWNPYIVSFYCCHFILYFFIEGTLLYKSGGIFWLQSGLSSIDPIIRKKFITSLIIDVTFIAYHS